MAALVVLMGTLENSAYPNLLANTAKHFAFIRCGELNLYEVVDAQIAVVENELLTSNDLPAKGASTSVPLSTITKVQFAIEITL